MDNTGKIKYKGEFNIHGQCFIEYTCAIHIDKAYQNFIHKLAKQTKIPVLQLRGIFNHQKDNFSIKKVI